ncbi:MAG TPA: hypothetical protein VMK12_18820 [Anaeromyxobacteraceae bacterium]|nr:hypothetical protein [Anaeromyxobacteraceae bacterium]
MTGTGEIEVHQLAQDLAEREQALAGMRPRSTSSSTASLRLGPAAAVEFDSRPPGDAGARDDPSF